MLVTSVTACIILAVWRKREALEQNHAFPFGPFLAAGLVLSLFIGDAAISGYLRILGL